MKNVTLKHYAAAGYPAVCVASSDEDRVISSVVSTFPKRPVLRIAAMGGLVDVRTGTAVDEKAGYLQAFGRAASVENTVLIVLDFQHSMESGKIAHTAQAYRMLRDMLPRIKQASSMLVLIAPTWQLPSEIEHDIPVMQDSLPTRAELSEALKMCTESTGAKIGDTAPLLDAASGLTLAEAESAFALSYAVSGQFDHTLVSAEKMKLVKQSGLAEIFEPAAPSTFGGYRTAVDCIENEIIPSMSDPDIAVSGMISDGVAGTGKTHLARVVAGMLGWPMMYVSLARLKGQYVGQSEQNVASVFRLARAIQPVVILFDELEKGLAGSASNGDSGVSKGIEGIFLTETQNIRDNGDRIFIVATTNDYQLLPVPVTRRLEIKFFFDLPNRAEREEIAAIKLAKHPLSDKGLAAKVADICADWTGAEIEDLIRSAARRCARKITADVIESASHDIKPISKVRADETSRLRAWGKANLRLANSPEKPAGSRPARKMSVINSDVADKLTGGNA